MEGAWVLLDEEAGVSLRMQKVAAVVVRLAIDSLNMICGMKSLDATLSSEEQMPPTSRDLTHCSTLKTLLAITQYLISSMPSVRGGPLIRLA